MEGNKIKYSKEFKSFEGTEWIGVDVVVNEGESWDEKWKEAQERVNRWGNRNQFDWGKPISESTMEISRNTIFVGQQPIPTHDISQEKTEIAIENAKSLDELAALKMQAEKYYLVKAYTEKMKQFV